MIDRHDRVQKKLVRALTLSGYAVQTYNVFSTAKGIRKTDIVVWDNTKYFIVDPKLVSDSGDTEILFQIKARKCTKKTYRRP